jgi:hypothetical protein
MMMHTMPHTKTKQKRDVDEFENEMEAERDKRALAIESIGGVEHQKSLSRSSSASSLSSLHKMSRPSTSQKKPPMDGKGVATVKAKKTVKFAKNISASTSRNQDSGPPVEAAEDAEPGNQKKDFYDSIYFDSDESEGEDDVSKNTKQKKRAFLSDDDLFYDPESDDRDQAWVNRRRQKCHPEGEPSKNPNAKPSTSTSASLPTSDAVLNCPACFTTLCMDCQRHEFYSNQYRAMFVMNCMVDKSETLRVPIKEAKSKNRRNKKQDLVPSELERETLGQIPSSTNDLFNPVKCKICSTQVAVYDSEEVYHFFNVLSSYV